jgi:hypothetical protein
MSQFIERHFTSAEMLAFMRKVGAARGVAVPRGPLMKPRLREFLRHLSRAECSRYLAQLARRRDSGEPLVQDP